MRLAFLGAAGEVTGSCYLVDTGEIRFLLECGMFQGGRAAGRRNRRFGFDPRSIAFVLLSHAHIDHSGLIPRLVAAGFSGPVYATRPTCDLLGVMLPDSGYLQEREAEREGQQPLYTAEEARRALARLEPVEYGRELLPQRAVRCTFRDAGHILGSAILDLRVGRTRLVFSGDLGQPGHPLVREPEPVESADVLLVESTYGDRDHKNLAQTLDEFAYALTDTLASRRGNVVIPAFSVGRTQDLLYFIGELRREGRLPPMAIYVDSPMAAAATRITLKYAELPGLPEARFTESLEDSMRINAVRSGAVIIAASGMCEGGRVRHHLRHNIARPECAIVFVGFQAAGTLGRRIVDGAKTVRLFGENHPVRARVFTIGGLSAHADRTALLGWLGRFRRAPRATWVVHGEPHAALALREALRARGWSAEVPAPGRSVELAP
ncbi:MAG TPA: MBL fold metallo-hydrolase [Burkholderiales bacterium]|nr:MBL fold metallo-hydrolase [Burkholderiales bacterium]